MKRFGLIKPSLDAHTLGINLVYEVLKEVDENVILANKDIEIAINNLTSNNKMIIKNWIEENKLNMVGISYRLDPNDAFRIVDEFMKLINPDKKFNVFFAGLPKSCNLIKAEYPEIIVFEGGEAIVETLQRLGVKEDKIPKEYFEGSEYDDELFAYSKELITNKVHLDFKPIKRIDYPEHGTKKDSVFLRIDKNMNDSYLPLTRAHVGPYSANKSRKESVNEFVEWVKKLANDSYLDIVSIGSSQLTQELFNEDWTGKSNGGGVPIQTPQEYIDIYNASRPLLLRTYSGTKNIPELAKIHEDTINNAWTALSIWWFNKLDGRGPYDLLENLEQHFKTIEYLSEIDKPFEPNIPHHFSFRGGDDVTYVLSAYLAALLAKDKGITKFILQIMLNTPRYTWGIQDIAKARTALKLIRELEDENFQVAFQPRAGLDYFSTDLEFAKVQLSKVTLLMDDIEPDKNSSPELIHVVSYSEASELATPKIINESVQITQSTLKEYREYKKTNLSFIHKYEDEVSKRVEELYEEVKTYYKHIKNNIKDLFTPKGFYELYTKGYLTAPYLWSDNDEYKKVKMFKTRLVNGSVKVVDETNRLLTTNEKLTIIRNN